MSPSKEAQKLLSVATKACAPVAVTPVGEGAPGKITKTVRSGKTVLLYEDKVVDFHNQGASFLNAFDAEAALHKTHEAAKLRYPDCDVPVFLNEGDVLEAPAGHICEVVTVASQNPTYLDHWYCRFTEGRVRDISLDQIFQYNYREGLHSGDVHKVLEGNACLEHTIVLSPAQPRLNGWLGVSGYNNTPLARWYQSRPVWYIAVKTQRNELKALYAVPMNLSDDALHDMQSMSMACLRVRMVGQSIEVAVTKPLTATRASSPLNVQGRDGVTLEAEHVTGTRDLLRMLRTQLRIPFPSAPVLPPTPPMVSSGGDHDQSAMEGSKHPVAWLSSAFKLSLEEETFWATKRAEWCETTDPPGLIAPMLGTTETLAYAVPPLPAWIAILRLRDVCATSSVVRFRSSLRNGIIVIWVGKEEVREYGTEIHRLPHLAVNASAGPDASVFACFDTGSNTEDKTAELTVRWMYGAVDPALFSQSGIAEGDVPETGTEVDAKQFFTYLRSYPANAEAAGLSLFVPVPSATPPPSPTFPTPNAEVALPAPLELHDLIWRYSRSDATDTERAAWVGGVHSCFEAAIASQLESEVVIPSLRGIISEAILAKIMQSKASVAKLNVAIERLSELAKPTTNMDVLDASSEFLKEHAIVLPDAAKADIRDAGPVRRAIRKVVGACSKKLRSLRKGRDTPLVKVLNKRYLEVFRELVLLGKGTGLLSKHHVYNENPNLRQVGGVAGLAKNSAAADVLDDDALESLMEEAGIFTTLRLRLDMEAWRQGARTNMVATALVAEEPGEGYNRSYLNGDKDDEIEDDGAVTPFDDVCDPRHEFAFPIPEVAPGDIMNEESIPALLKEGKSPYGTLLKALFKRYQVGTVIGEVRMANAALKLLADALNALIANLSPKVVERAEGEANADGGEAGKELVDEDHSSRTMIRGILYLMVRISAMGDKPHSMLYTLFNFNAEPKIAQFNEYEWYWCIVALKAVDYAGLTFDSWRKMEQNRRMLLQASVQRHIARHAITAMQEERKANAESHSDYLKRLNTDHYPRYRDLVKMLNRFLKVEQDFRFTAEELEQVTQIEAMMTRFDNKRTRDSYLSSLIKLISNAASRARNGHGDRALRLLLEKKDMVCLMIRRIQIKYLRHDDAIRRSFLKIALSDARNDPNNHADLRTKYGEILNRLEGRSEMLNVMAAGQPLKPFKNMEQIMTLVKKLIEDPSLAVTLSELNLILNDICEVKSVAQVSQFLTKHIRRPWWMCRAADDAAAAAAAAGGVAAGTASPQYAMVSFEEVGDDNHHLVQCAQMLGDDYWELVGGIMSPDESERVETLSRSIPYHRVWFEQLINLTSAPRALRGVVDADDRRLMWFKLQRLIDETIVSENRDPSEVVRKVFSDVV